MVIYCTTITKYVKRKIYATGITYYYYYYYYYYIHNFKQMIEFVRQAKEIMVSLGEASKMPCPTYNTPASLCVTGSKLRKTKGTTCHNCYAMRGNYLYPSVHGGLKKRFNAFNHPRFVEAMTFMINRYSAKSGYFRWFDSGDLADMQMLEKIVMVCQNTPKIKH